MPNINKMLFHTLLSEIPTQIWKKLARDQNDKYFAGKYEGKALLP